MTTKEKILFSALKLFAKQGIDKTSTAGITRDAGMAEGTLFVHFKTKQSLIDGLYIQIKKASIGELEKKVDPKLSVEKNFRAICEELIEYYIENYSAFVFIEQIERDPRVSKKALKEAKREYAGVEKIISEWQKEKKLKGIGVELLRTVIWSSCASIIRFYHSRGMRKTKERHLDIVWDAVKK